MHGIFLMYDISDRKSFQDIQRCLSIPYEYANMNLSKAFWYAKPDVELVLVGLKTDIPGPDHKT
jgi:hypothetical protein